MYVYGHTHKLTSKHNIRLINGLIIKGYHYGASTRLKDQSSENCLEDEPQVGTPIRQSLNISKRNIRFRVGSK